jgi:hypothetical protein
MHSGLTTSRIRGGRPDPAGLPQFDSSTVPQFPLPAGRACARGAQSKRGCTALASLAPIALCLPAVTSLSHRHHTTRLLYILRLVPFTLFTAAPGAYEGRGGSLVLSGEERSSLISTAVQNRTELQSLFPLGLSERAGCGGPMQPRFLSGPFIAASYWPAASNGVARGRANWCASSSVHSGTGGRTTER